MVGFDFVYIGYFRVAVSPALQLNGFNAFAGNPGIAVFGPVQDIQKIRFNDKFLYAVDLQEGLEECVIPKLIIQPIVENSVLHGLKESEEGNILVRITEQEDVLCIEVTDDGCGAPEERMDAINHRRQEQLVGHIGVSNVDTIIRLTYGEEYGIHMESLTPNIENTMDGQRTEEEGEVHGTKVTLRLPVRYGEA